MIISSSGATWGSASLIRSGSAEAFTGSGTISGSGVFSSSSGFGGSDGGSLGAGGWGAGCFLTTGGGFFGEVGGGAASGAEMK